MFTLKLQVELGSRLGQRISFLQHLAALAVVESVRTLPGYQVQEPVFSLVPDLVLVLVLDLVLVLVLVLGPGPYLLLLIYCSAPCGP